MIEKMKKVSIIFTSHDANSYLSKLQEYGLVDIAYNTISDATHSSVVKKYNDVCQVLDILESTDVQESTSVKAQLPSLDDGVIEQVLQHAQELHTLKEQYEEHNNTIGEMQPYGEVSAKDIAYLRENNVFCNVYCYSATDKQNKKREKHTMHYTCFDLFKKKDYMYCLVVSTEKDAFSPPSQWKECIISDFSPHELHTKILDISNAMRIVQEKIFAYSVYKQTLLDMKIALENEISILSVQNEAKQYDTILVIEGFIPQAECDSFYSFCRKNKLGVVIDEVKDEDDVPTKQKNLPPIRIMKPLFKLMDTVPGYKEFDISGMFLLALTLFFGMIIGDAGYGIVLLISSLMGFLLIKQRNDITNLTLLFLLWNSFATIAWGAMSGNWFGYAPFAETGVLSYLVIPAIAITNPSSAQNIWYFAFTVGLIHLCIAHFWGIIRGIRLKDIFFVINHLGSGVMIYGLYHLVLTLLLGAEAFPFPSYALVCIIIGFVLVVISADQSPNHNFFVGIGIGIAKILLHALDSLGNFADIISYIRLFAVGLASLSIASAFNDMAQSIMSSGTVIGYVGGVAVLIFAHTFNLAMGLLAIIIHGVRLNILEFGMHIGMEWSGRVYSPFRKK